MTRRTVLGGLAAVLLAAAGGAAWKLHWMPHYYPATPYDDLLHQIVDREPAAKLGAVVAQARPSWTAETLAARLRLPGKKLAEQAKRDAAQNRLIEADGWVLPESVALYAALAAKA